MRFLLDSAPKFMSQVEMDSEIVAGQLLTPLTRYANNGGVFAIDNGAFSGFNRRDFEKLLTRELPNRDRCLFVAMPDVVGNMRRTLELFEYRDMFAPDWPHALVVQDGAEDFNLPWRDLQAVFIGGGDPWKDSNHSQDIVRTAKALGKHVHVGRVNTPRRYKLFSDLGADTCDGSGVSRYDHMLKAIVDSVNGGDPQTLLNWEPLAILENA